MTKDNTLILPRPLKAALIDMDGTLYDSMPNHARAWLKMVTELGIDATFDEFFRYEGRTGKSTINLLMRRAFGRDASDEEARELYRRKTIYFAEQPPVNVMPGADRMISALTGAGINTILVTGSGQNSLINRLPDDFPGAFPPERRITSRDVSHGKPDPEPYLKALALAGVGPSEVIVIENAPLGVESGHRAGVYTVAVTTGPIAAAEMWRAGADAVFDSMELFADILQQKLNYE